MIFNRQAHLVEIDVLHQNDFQALRFNKLRSHR